MNEPIVCPVCHHKNTVGALICANCSMPLPIPRKASETTRHVPDVVLGSPQLPQIAELPPDTLAVLIQGRTEPILFHNPAKIILGRLDARIDIPMLDLTPYDGLLLGVSRQHASLTRIDNGYVLEDQGSTNGTWINHNQLPPHRPRPVQNGDNVQLGQLSLHIYFTVTRAISNRFSLKRARADQPFTPEELAMVISPFLVALCDAQQVLNTVLKRTQAVTLISIALVNSNIQVQMTGAAEILQLLRETMLLGSDAPAPETTLLGAQNAPAEPTISASPNADQLRQLAERYIASMSDSIPEEPVSPKPYVDAMQSSLEALMNSGLTILNSE